MTGNELRNILKANGVVLADLARNLGMSQQVLNSRLNVKNLKIDFINDVMDATGINVMKEQNNSPSPIDSLIELLKKKDEQMDRLISLLESERGVTTKGKKNVG